MRSLLAEMPQRRWVTPRIADRATLLVPSPPPSLNLNSPPFLSQITTGKDHYPYSFSPLLRTKRKAKNDGRRTLTHASLIISIWRRCRLRLTDHRSRSGPLPNCNWTAERACGPATTAAATATATGATLARGGNRGALATDPSVEQRGGARGYVAQFPRHARHARVYPLEPNARGHGSTRSARGGAAYNRQSLYPVCPRFLLTAFTPTPPALPGIASLLCWNAVCAGTSICFSWMWFFCRYLALLG
jgi:hypothetical protein